ncbi:MAG TPA: hypothetical protein VMC85_23900 [Desulfomonilaceae bacterium]|nr:hypothetical protein [Desulfomonilaceae bacterium]
MEERNRPIPPFTKGGKFKCHGKSKVPYKRGKLKLLFTKEKIKILFTKERVKVPLY